MHVLTPSWDKDVQLQTSRVAEEIQSSEAEIDYKNPQVKRLK